jgi:hypothetical protein
LSITSGWQIKSWLDFGTNRIERTKELKEKRTMDSKQTFETQPVNFEQWTDKQVNYIWQHIEAEYGKRLQKQIDEDGWCCSVTRKAGYAERLLGSMLGKVGKDKVSGFAGTITAYGDYLHGTPRVCITALNDGKVNEEWFDVQRVVVE